MIDVLLAALTEVLNAQKDLENGNANIEDVRDAKKRFSQAFHQMIDYRIRFAFDVRRKQRSQERIAVADSINSSIKMTASTIKSISALNSAPTPPENLSDAKAMKKWKEEYEEWYNTKREEGISIK